MIEVYDPRCIANLMLDESDQMVRETYELWTEVSEARTADIRRRGASGGGLF
jgi:hypothetical protein